MSFFTPVRGQTLAVMLLERALAQNRLAPAYLFQGPAGVGKALTARCLAQGLLGKTNDHPDLLWVAPVQKTQDTGRVTPAQIRLEQVREITQFVGRTPWQSDRSLVVIEAAQCLNEPAQDALLKTLEEPGHSRIILLADRPDELLNTIRSRCQTIPFSNLDSDQMRTVLIEQDYGEIEQNPELLALACGSPGAAIAHWRQWQQLPPELPALFNALPHSLAQALELARRLTQTLEPAAQLWLTDYLQWCYWERYQRRELVQILEQTRQALLNYVQPQLVWEVTWMRIYHLNP
ncbi:DNA polymerase III subunit delta' [Gloeomargarita lithophora Alchichica-D10]|uniref:DNA polymerase III subunit delta n=1 Tax=Gloeomargarita lithophora Alchichica-D10 TaxID=1188229 RepID=A0A1J0ACB7_9CYAN|nr:AAA family ATPase [Gloeomargarita lithophora]APB33582.1 DNA polymerase III subunit delta' [Gloeomargarita lithophora Alchichica-D10]